MRFVRFLVFLIVLGGLCWGGWYAYTSYAKSASEEKAKAKEKQKPQPILVSATPVLRKDIPVYLDGLGTVQGFYTVTVRPQVDGELIEIAFTEGQTVRKGDLLARIDPEQYQAQVEQAKARKVTDEANLNNAKLNLTRYREAETGGAATKQNVTDAQTVVSQLDATVKADDANIHYYEKLLSYTTITSPIDGRTGLRYVDVGNIVHSSDPNGIVVVTQIEPISIFFTLPQKDLPSVMKRQNEEKLTVFAMDADGKTLLDQGTLELVDNQIDPTTGSMRMKAKLPNISRKLWPGQFVNVRLLLETRRNALTVPATAVQDGPNGSFVFVVKEDHSIDMRPVTVAMTQDGESVLEGAGVQEGQKVVLSGQDRLKVGSVVTLGEQKTKDGEKIANSDAPATVPLNPDSNNTKSHQGSAAAGGKSAADGTSTHPATSGAKAQ